MIHVRGAVAKSEFEGALTDATRPTCLGHRAIRKRQPAESRCRETSCDRPAKPGAPPALMAAWSRDASGEWRIGTPGVLNGENRLLYPPDSVRELSSALCD